MLFTVVVLAGEVIRFNFNPAQMAANFVTKLSTMNFRQEIFTFSSYANRVGMKRVDFLQEIEIGSDKFRISFGRRCRQPGSTRFG